MKSSSDRVDEIMEQIVGRIDTFHPIVTLAEIRKILEAELDPNPLKITFSEDEVELMVGLLVDAGLNKTQSVGGNLHKKLRAAEFQHVTRNHPSNQPAPQPRGLHAFPAFPEDDGGSKSP